MTISKLRIFAIAVAIFITTAIVAGVSSAQQFNWSQNRPQFDPIKSEQFKENNHQLSEERQNHQAKIDLINKAIESNDYQAWLEAIGTNSPKALAITEAEFPRLIEAHQLIKEAKDKIEQAKQIRQELGLANQFKGRKPFNKNFK